ncbi:MAG: hypothetical protein WCQ54_12025 [Clostridiaceae bacterium]
MVKNLIKKLPGFRTGIKWKMIFAAVIYLSVIVIMVNAPGVTLGDKFIFILQFFIIMGIPFVLIANVGNIRSKLPIFNKKSIKFNILGSFIVFIIIIMGVSAVDSLKSPQQKRLDILAAQQAASEKAASKVDSMIKALGDVNTLTLDKTDDVKEVRTSYESLTSYEKGFVTKLAVLVSAEKKITDLQADADKKAAEKEALAKKAGSEIDAKITALGDVNTLTMDKAAEVKAIRTAYEALTTEQKEFVTKLTVLVSAEKKITDLQAAADKALAEKAAENKKALEEKALAEKAAENKKALAEKAAADYKEWISNQFSAWDGSHIYLVKLVKENLNDPSSFKHVNTVYWDKGNYLIVKMTYRANNAFGALILQNVTAKSDYKTDTITIISQND